MYLIENIILAVNGLISNKMRALLTMLGIIIGIGSVIAITSVGNAMTSYMSESINSFGITNIYLYLNPIDNNHLKFQITKDDLITDEMIEKLTSKYPGKINSIEVKQSIGTGKITHNHDISSVSLNGINEGGLNGEYLTMLKGRFISQKDCQRQKKVAVISERLVLDLFPYRNPIGQEIKMETSYGYETFTVVGVFEEKASSMFRRSDARTTFYIPVTTAQEISGANSGYDQIVVTAVSGIDYTAFGNTAKDYLNRSFYKNNKNCKIGSESIESDIEISNTMMSTLSLAIKVIAGISLLVGGIGVMNIMLVSVTERTREIGVRKALGAPDSAIRVQFIVESMIICLIGGILGIFAGAGLGALGGLLLKQTAVPDPATIVIAVGFSMIIGVFFGYYPANKAAKLDPIEALRYE